jgi:CRP-like cAMP-binding protein
MDNARIFIKKFPLKHFSKGETFIYQDAEIDSLYAVRSGFIKIHDSSPTGDEQLIWVAKKYDFVPLEWLFSNVKVSRFYYTAFTDLEAYAVSKTAFLAYVQEHPEVMPDIVRAISDKCNDAMLLINAIQKPRVREKLIYTLSFISSRLVDPTAQESKQSVMVPLTQQDLADLSGMTRTTAAVELKRLKDEGYINYDKSSLVINLPKLEELL